MSRVAVTPDVCYGFQWPEVVLTGKQPTAKIKPLLRYIFFLSDA